MKPARFYYCLGSFVAPCPVLIRCTRDAMGIHGRLHFSEYFWENYVLHNSENVKFCKKFTQPLAQIVPKIIPITTYIQSARNPKAPIKSHKILPIDLSTRYIHALFQNSTVFSRQVIQKFVDFRFGNINPSHSSTHLWARPMHSHAATHVFPHRFRHIF
jgi:hypothetical protein